MAFFDTMCHELLKSVAIVTSEVILTFLSVTSQFFWKIIGIFFSLLSVQTKAAPGHPAAGTPGGDRYDRRRMSATARKTATMGRGGNLGKISVQEHNRW